MQTLDHTWSSTNVDLLMIFIASDCERHVPVGSEPGKRFIGNDGDKIHVKKAFRKCLV